MLAGLADIAAIVVAESAATIGLVVPVCMAMAGLADNSQVVLAEKIAVVASAAMFEMAAPDTDC